jgi:hypothetical protein
MKNSATEYQKKTLILSAARNRVYLSTNLLINFCQIIRKENIWKQRKQFTGGALHQYI